MKIEKWFEVDKQYSRLGKHNWSVARLIQLSKDFEVMEIPINHLNIYYKYDDLRLRDFVMQAVLSADLDYPIILDEDGEIHAQRIWRRGNWARMARRLRVNGR